MRSRPRWASAACCSRCSCARGRMARYELSPASGAGAPRRSRGWRRSRRSCASATTPRALELALIENMAREDLSPIEEARACAALVEELGLTREEVGRRVGRSRVAVSNLMRLLDLPDEVIELLQEGVLSEGHGRALLLAEDHGERRSLARAAAEGGWSVRVTEDRARASNGAGAGGATIRARRSARGEPHPDQLAAAREIGEALGERARRRGVGATRPRRGLSRRAAVRLPRGGAGARAAATPHGAVAGARRVAAGFGCWRPAAKFQESESCPHRTRIPSVA